MKCQRDSVYDKGERDRDQREISERERDGREREREQLPWECFTLSLQIKYLPVITDHE